MRCFVGVAVVDSKVTVHIRGCPPRNIFNVRCIKTNPGKLYIIVKLIKLKI